MNKLCELCHRHYGIMVCEHCYAAICSACSAYRENDLREIAAWVTLCNACATEADEGVSYLEKVRRLAIAKGIDPDVVEQNIIHAAIVANWDAERMAHAFLAVMGAYELSRQQVNKLKIYLGES